MIPVLALAHSDKGSEVRWQAVNALSVFKQQSATQELRGFLKDKDSWVQSAAAQALAKRKDPTAIEVLVAIAHDNKNQWRAYIYKALLNFPNDPRVEPTIKLGLSDTDSFTRRQAQEALEELHTTRKSKSS
jgi:HEAT repeat protein